MEDVLLSEIQPSQFYISDLKLKNIWGWFNKEDLSNFSPIPVKMLDDELIMTDGHTRAVAAILSGLSKVPLIWQEDDLDWNLYRLCVKECKNRAVYRPGDLIKHHLSVEDYAEMWIA
ncbi:hypothetical protein EII17_09395 [Clostridiales bacterium COT073_COT-073]|nr:hypothetical protein EII17_09395 [Clostridiales bacterium COT073_COT-073]